MSDSTEVTPGMMNIPDAYSSGVQVPSVLIAIPGNFEVCVALQWFLTCSGSGLTKLPEMTMLGALMAVCQLYGCFEAVCSHLLKWTMLCIASAWVCLPALIMFELLKTRNLPLFLWMGVVLTLKCMQLTPFFMSPCARSASEYLNLVGSFFP